MERSVVTAHSMGTGTTVSAAATTDMDVQRYREFLCGWGAAIINITTTFPLNKVMFRQQLHGITTRKAIIQLRQEGLSHLYRGLLPPLLQKSMSLSLMFGMYDWFSVQITKENPRLPRTLNQVTAALLAGGTEALLTPFERVQTLLQDPTHHKSFNNTMHAFKVLQPYGVGEYFRGLTPILMRNGPSNAFFFIGRERIKNSLPSTESTAGNVVLDFISGAILGAVISTTFYPVNVVKTKMQSVVGGKYLSFFRALLLVLEERNYSLKKMFRGIHVNYTRSLISWGIINASYEVIKKSYFTNQYQH